MSLCLTMRKILKILVLCVLVLNYSYYSYADAKFDKDLKKISKNNGFVDSKGKIYPPEEIADKKNTILIIYNHGARNDQKIDKCLDFWAKVPPAYSSAEFASLLLEDQNVVVTPGSGYGPSGEGFIRLSLTLSDEDLEKAIARLSEWSIPKQS